MKLSTHVEVVKLVVDMIIDGQGLIEETLKEIAIIQKNGKHVNSYRLLDAYRVGVLWVIPSSFLNLYNVSVC